MITPNNVIELATKAAEAADPERPEAHFFQRCKPGHLVCCQATCLVCGLGEAIGVDLDFEMLVMS